MKRVYSVFFAFICSVALAKEPIVFAPLPMQDKASLLREFSPMLEYLKKQTKKEFQIDYYQDYATLLEKFIEGKIDLLYLGPLPFISLQEQFHQAKPLVFFKDKKGAHFYTCSLISFMDTKIDLTKPLKETSIALTQPLSTCGYLSVNHMLKRMNSTLEENYYSYAGRHDKVALLVAQKKAFLGGVKTSIAEQYHNIGVDILATTEPMPMFALVGNEKTLQKEILNKIQKLLLQTPKQEYQNWGEKIRHGTTKASVQDYFYVKALKKGVDIPTKGNTLQ